MRCDCLAARVHVTETVDVRDKYMEIQRLCCCMCNGRLQIILSADSPRAAGFGSRRLHCGRKRLRAQLHGPGIASLTLYSTWYCAF
jgi:hypothetical protein